MNREIRGVLALALAVAALSSCTNGVKPSIRAITGTTATTPNTGGDGTSGLVLSTVVRSALDPSSKFDLIGDGSGAIGQSCYAPGGGNSPTGPSTCRCNYSYIDSSGNTQQEQADTEYHEDNLLRCSYVMVPADASYVNVSINIPASNLYSNTVQVSLTGSGSIINLADAKSYVRFNRYQCRDAVNIFMPNNQDVINPVMSDDPHLSFPLNFYTTSFYTALVKFSSEIIPQDGTGWICPMDPSKNDAASGYDMSLYSQAPIAGTVKIFPPNPPSDDRVTFYVPPRASGVFRIPLNVYYAPKLNTALADAAIPPMGYGAAPIPTGLEQETCPDTSVVIPAGYQWMKLWQFRASLAPRSYKSPTGISGLGDIACDGGLYSDGHSVFPDCTDATVSPGFTYTATSGLGKRALMSFGPYCVLPLPATAAGGPSWTSMASAGGTTDGAGNLLTIPVDYTSLTPGSDLWAHGGYGAAFALNPLNLNTATNSKSPPYNTLSSDQQLETTSRYDFVYVVTPTTVMSHDFKTNSALAQGYTPYRFQTPQDCQSGDPQNPAFAGDCSSQYRIPYAVTFHDLTQNADAPGDDGGRAPVFPMCVLQKVNGP